MATAPDPSAPLCPKTGIRGCTQEHLAARRRWYQLLRKR